MNKHWVLMVYNEDMKAIFHTYCNDKQSADFLGRVFIGRTLNPLAASPIANENEVATSFKVAETQIITL